MISRLPSSIQGWAKAGGITTGVLGAGYLTKPFVLAQQHYFADRALSQDDLSPDVKARLTAQRRQNFENWIMDRYVRQGSGSIDWYNMAEIVDVIARNTPSDIAFRKDIWHLFGWREGHVRAPLAHYLDSNNRGLPSELHNTGYQSPQMHHYLGGVTGNTTVIPSHLQNNRLYALGYEFLEFIRRGKYNWGDVRLFNVAEKHRDDFLKNGRFVVAKNIRAMLEPFLASQTYPVFSPGVPSPVV